MTATTVTKSQQLHVKSRHLYCCIAQRSYSLSYCVYFIHCTASTAKSTYQFAV